MAALEHADAAIRQQQLPELDRQLLDLTVDQDTFEVLYRRRLQLAIAPALDVRDAAEPKLAPPARRRRLTLGSVLGVVVAVLAAADLILTGWWALERDRGRGRGRESR